MSMFPGFPDGTRLLVTGGAGFIGSHLVDALLEAGAEVTVLDDLTTGDPERLDPRAELRRVDVTDAAALGEAVRSVRPDAVCHLAAQIDVRVSVADPAADARVNVEGTINVLEAARAVGARVVFASTGGALYGEGVPVPTGEDTLPGPGAPYGTAKYCAEQYVGLFNRLHGTRHSVLRLGNVYGPRQSPGGEAGVIAIHCGLARDGEVPTVFGDGTQTRDYVYVGDVAEAFLAALRHPAPGVWNIGTGKGSTVLEVLDHIAAASGRELRPRFAPRRPGEIQHSTLDVSRAAADLGWTASVPLEKGIAATYDWVRSGSPVRQRA
ncbi:NAD-dependent epimerase/dehydratase family protein [Streptomyces mobaraensis]|uniref:NAD-dependent epimerase/dehydratase family protein n=1 Tax=Streptomyces mobaraensis TaxID=35621 RepID=A0A5N5WA80_STRMB|nr:NAD-dependent epimerase/dehydratase family protein [Streptomyces mobaraensis]KAB7847756.1 NAD-dependent epimerase/dehydratase family protein [Streptomyces mobaraensis]